VYVRAVSKYNVHSMAKRGYDASTVPALLDQPCKNAGWALCIGAGTSIPAFPSWREFVKRLMLRDPVGDATGPMCDALVQAFSPDALIQAAHDRTSGSDADFAALLAAELYRELQDTTGEQWHLVAQALGAKHQGQLSLDQWNKFVLTIKTHYPLMSALFLAAVIGDAVRNGRAPAAILSFNAEPLLLALLNAAMAQASAGGPQRTLLDRVTRATTDRKVGRIPYVFCHGLLPIPGVRASGPKDAAVDKLVFSESDYLQMANTAFSWQSSVFLDTCVARTVVFVGVSLSDPNMRRWLSWVQRNRLTELREVFDSETDSAQHYWLNCKPASEAEARWVESTVAHLGVRLVWLTSWTEGHNALIRMLDL
jgi:SIR2-like domain